jgi:hypothetical protein
LGAQVARPIEPFNFESLTREDLGSRGGKVGVEEFAKPTPAGATFADWLLNLPNILAAQDLITVVDAVVAAHTAGRSVHLSMGAHVVKVGLGPVLIDLIERGVVTGVSVNGAFAIHDFEIAAVGFTSEDVDATLGAGAFGMSDQTGRAYAEFVARATRENIGLGQAAAALVAEGDYPHREKSVLAACGRHDVPLTIHAAIGTDIVHLHPALNAADFGAALMLDFRIFTTLVSRMAGGVYFNIGSAVLLPEVFLKALSAARNSGHRVDELTCVNLDFIRHYRPMTNVVTRPVAQSGRGINLVGHHEIMVALLAAAVIQRLESLAEDE